MNYMNTNRIIRYLEEKQEILGKEIVSLHSQLEAQQTHEKNSAHVI